MLILMFVYMRKYVNAYILNILLKNIIKTEKLFGGNFCEKKIFICFNVCFFVLFV